MEIEVAEAVAIYCLARLGTRAIEDLCENFDEIILNITSILEAEHGTQIHIDIDDVRELAVELICHGLNKNRHSAQQLLYP